MNKYLNFPLDEYRSRVNKAKLIMEKEGLDACIFSKGTNLTYFSGYYTYLFDSDFRPFYFLLPLEGEPVLIVTEHEYNGALRTSWIDTVKIWGNNDKCESTDPVKLLAKTIQEKKLGNTSIGFELENGQRMGMTFENFQQLRELLPNVKIKSNDKVVWSCRSIKSPLEIEFMRKTCAANDLGFSAAIDVINAGVTEKDVELAMCEGFLQGGALPTFMVITSGPERNSMANPKTTNKVINEGEFICMDFGCNYAGYISDVTRSVFVGEVPDRVSELFKAVHDLHEQALASIKPGVPVSAIDSAVTMRCQELGYSDLILHRAGHALGLEIHELPSISPIDFTIMEPGMVLAIEPNLYEYNIGAIRIEDNIVVTEKGCEVLNKSSTELVVR